MAGNLFPNLLMISSSFLWTTGYIYANENNIHPLQFLMLRGVMIVVVSYLVCFYRKRVLLFRIDKMYQLHLRNSIETFHGLFIALSQFYIPLYATHTISSTGIIFVILLDYLLDKKSMDFWQFLSVLATFLGVILIINAPFIENTQGESSTQANSQFQNYVTTDIFTISLVSIGLVIVMGCWSYSVKLTERIKLSAEQGNLSLGLSFIFVSSIGYFFVEKPTSPQILFPGYIYSGLIIALAQWCFVESILKSEQVGKTMVMGNSCIIFGYIFSILRYREPISVICMIGSAITVGGIAKLLI